MSGSLDSRAKVIFGEALELERAGRDDYLKWACAGDPALLERVCTLLAAAERDDQFLSVPPEPPGVTTPDLLSGSRIGNYTIAQKIGEGGFGDVYLAHQEQPVRRPVALKIIKPGMDSRAVITRFEQERQALALMDHPNIARVYDAGATESGHPYFAMEYVDGMPITTFCDARRLDIRARLELLTQVCRAVQHAHTKGLIHRDIKPSNILVKIADDDSSGGRGGAGGAAPVCKVIDFGIAKAMQGPLTARTLFTESGDLIGTPEYMSPEQAAGSADIDTRSDVYALGVLAYELLAGAPPFDPRRLRSAAWGEMQRIIREVDPPAPSTRVSQLAGESKEGHSLITEIAAQRSSQPSRLTAALRGELDWIVLKAMEKERARRYETPGAIAADLQRYLTGQPVEAAPPALMYRMRKFVRRNRFGVLAGSAVATALVLGIAGASAGLVNARRSLERAVAAEQAAQASLAETESARDQAERSRKIASAVTDFFTLDILRLDPAPPGTPELTMREVLDRIPQRIDQHFRSDPAIEGAIRERAGQLYLNMGDARRASEFLEPAADLLEKGLGPDHRETLMARQRLGRLLLDLGRYERAGEVFNQVYQSRLNILGANHNFTLNSLVSRGMARVMAGDAENGLRDVEHGTSEARRLFGETSQPALIFSRELIDAYTFAGRPEAAEELARAQLALIATRPDYAAASTDFRHGLGTALLAQNRFQESLAELDVAWGVLGTTLPGTHPKVVNVRIRRGAALAGLGRSDEAAAELSAAYHVLEPVYGASATRCRDIARRMRDISVQSGDEAGALLWRSRS